MPGRQVLDPPNAPSRRPRRGGGLLRASAHRVGRVWVVGRQSTRWILADASPTRKVAELPRVSASLTQPSRSPGNGCVLVVNFSPAVPPASASPSPHRPVLSTTGRRPYRPPAHGGGPARFPPLVEDPDGHPLRCPTVSATIVARAGDTDLADGVGKTPGRQDGTAPCSRGRQQAPPESRTKDTPHSIRSRCRGSPAPCTTAAQDRLGRACPVVEATGRGKRQVNGVRHLRDGPTTAPLPERRGAAG